jgi:predicted nuclease with TOPRIM domain
MGQGMDGMNESWEPDDNAEIPRQRRNNLLPEKDRLRVEADSLFKRAKKAEEKNKALSARIAELEAALAEARKDADYWDTENGRMLELCRQKLGKRDVHGVADGIDQLAALAAEAREDAARLKKVLYVFSTYQGSALGCNPQILFTAISDAARGKP